MGSSRAPLSPSGANVDPRHYQRERARDRSLLFVATTRARDELAVFWHGARSRFITDALASRAVE